MAKKMNWGSCRKAGASYAPKRQIALKLQRREYVAATEKQLAYLRALGIEYPRNVTKPQASRLISGALESARLLDKEIQRAMERDGE